MNPPALQSTLKSFLDENLNLTTQSVIMVGVSGGRDSMVLLDLLRRIGESVSFRLMVLHFNYRSHARSDEALDLLRAYTSAHELDLIGAEILTPEALRERRVGFEAEARQIRYNFFGSVADFLGTSDLFLAHHWMDQVETILLNLGRGSGLHGLSGMNPLTRRNVLTIHRPFLSVKPDRLQSYAERRDLEYVDDPTNWDLNYARNRFRHRILPEWRKAQPDPDRAVFRLGRRARLENEFWESYVKDNFTFWSWSNEIQVRRDIFRKRHPAGQFRFLHYLVRKLNGTSEGWSEQNFRDVRRLFCDGRSGARLSLPSPVSALNELNRGCLFDTTRSTEQPESGSVQENWSRTYEGVGTVRIEPDQKLFRDASDPVFYSCLDCRNVSLSLVRTWKKGDRVESGKGAEKLKTLFDQYSVPYRARRLWPLLVKNGRILVVPGLMNDVNAGNDRVWVGFWPDHPTYHQLYKELFDPSSSHVKAPENPW